MKKALAILASIAVLTACATPTDPTIVASWKAEAMRTIPKCKSATECDVKWAAARQYILQHSAWKIQRMTGDFIETFSPPTGVVQLAYRVTKTPLSDGSYAIEGQTWCGTEYTECSPHSWHALRDMNRFINAAWKPS